MADEPGTAVIETPPPATTPLGEIFDRAADRSQTQRPTEPRPPAPPPPIEPPVPAKEPAVAKEPAPPATTEEFVPPDVLLGEEPAPAPKEPSVADLMPEEPPVAIRTEKGKADYKKWREHQIGLEKQLKELKGKPQTSADANVLAENELLKSRLTELSSVVERADLMSHPAFQNQFVKPRQTALESATQVLKDAEIDPAGLQRALNSSGKARIEALDELNESITSPTVRMRMIELVSEIERLDQQQAAAMSDIKGTHERLQLEDRATRHRMMQDQVKQLNQLYDGAVEALRDKAGFEFLRKIDGNDRWNAVVDDMIAQGRDLLTNNSDPQQVAAAAVLAPMALKYQKAYQSEAKRRIAAEKELAEYKSTDPGLSGKERVEGGEEETSGISAIFKRAERGWGLGAT